MPCESVAVSDSWEREADEPASVDAEDDILAMCVKVFFEGKYVLWFCVVVRTKDGGRGWEVA